MARVRLPTILRSYAAGQSTVDADGSTVGQVNDEDVRYQGGLEATVGEADEVSILPAVAGGSG